MVAAQHSNCTPELQRKFLSAMRNAAENNDVPAKQIAFLTDRIRFNENKPQVYGTILDWDETGALSCVVDDAENLDARRKEVGLSPYQEELEKHMKEVQAEGGVCPENIRAFKQQGRDWARSVGWLE